MTTLLQIKSSMFSDAGQSSLLADRYVAQWRTAHPSGTVIVRDLARTSLPHLDAARFEAFLAKPEERTPEQLAVVAESDALIDELRQADSVVLSLPMYNFGVPSVLKAYFDHIARAGVTFRYTEKGPVGLLGGKSVLVLATRGGIYAGTAHDSQSAYVRSFLGFLGMDDVQFIYAEGLGLGEASKAKALAAARQAIDERLEPVRLAA